MSLCEAGQFVTHVFVQNSGYLEKEKPPELATTERHTRCFGLTLKTSSMLLSMKTRIRSSLSLERVLLWTMALEKDFFTTSRFSSYKVNAEVSRADGMVYN